MKDKHWLFFFTFLAFIVFVFLLLIIVSLKDSFPKRFVNVSKTPQATVLPSSLPGWGIYINEKQHYSLAIPPNWEVKAQDDNESIVNILPNNYNPSDEVPVVISVQPNAKKVSIDGWIDILLGANHPREEIKIGSVTWTRVASTLTNYQAIIYFTSYNNKIVELYNSVLKGSDGELFHKMFPTFAFTD